jgi:hypothetical protein
MNKWIKRLLLIFEIGGGFLGLALIAKGVAASEITPVFIMLNVIFAGLFSLGIVAGLALVEKPHLGLRLSLIYQALQIPMFASPVITYILTSGFMVGVYLQLVTGQFKFGANFNLGSQFQFHLFKDMPWLLGVNIVAVVLFVAVRKVIRSEPEPKDGEVSSENTLSDELSS